MFEQIKLIPKIELHVHLDGSVNKELMLKLCDNKYNMVELEDMVCASKEDSLKSYLEKFKLPISLMQNKDNLLCIVDSFVNDLVLDNCIYAEVRFAPFLHTMGGLSQDEVVSIIIDAFKKHAVKVNLILCCMRDMDKVDNIETITVARKYLDKGVCAIDLAGDEEFLDTSSFDYIFDIAKLFDIPFTIHAGETGNVNSLGKALLFGSNRIGHGISCIKSGKLCDKIINDGITLEVCPSSNIMTGAVSKMSEHPIYELYKKGVLVTISTDNRTVSDTNLINEYCKVSNCFPFTINDFVNMNVSSINASFLSSSEKEELLAKYMEITNQILNG